MLFYRRCDEAHYPLIKGIAPDQGMGGGFGPLWPNPLEINSNNYVISLFNQSKTEISERIGQVPILMISQNKINFEIQRRDL
jgi:hypothetical protein